jgi:alpha-L-rhamnosidase
VWEEWGGVDAAGVPHASLDHYSKGAVITFLHQYVAGLQCIEPGYRRFRVAPRPGGGLTWATAAHESPYGRIEVRWHQQDDGLTVDVTVPPGTTAEVLLPTGASTTFASGRFTVS